MMRKVIGVLSIYEIFIRIKKCFEVIHNFQAQWIQRISSQKLL